MTTSNLYLIKLGLKNSDLAKELLQIIRSVGSFEIIETDDSRRPDLFIFELGEHADQELELIQSLLEEGEVDEVFLTSKSAEPAVLMRAIRVGAKEFFSLPIKSEEVAQSLKRFKARRQKPGTHQDRKKGQLISVFGSKGGVGTTTVAVNLAVSMARHDTGSSVVLLDMNTLFGEIPLFLEMSPKFHWGEITKNVDRLDNTFLSNILAKHNTGVQLLPSPAYLNGHVRPTPEIMARLIDLMKRMFDYVIVDGGQSTDDTSLKVFEISDALLLITILSLPCLTNTNKLLKSFTDLGYVQKDRIKIVLNRYMKKSEISLKDAETGIGKELFWIIPNDFSSTMSAINNGKPLAQILPKAQITKNFKQLADAISPSGKPKNEKKWRLFKR
jgi:pilus assembly protein CpaE